MATEGYKNSKLVDYFRKRAARLEPVATTRTPSGQILDWLPIESQRADGVIAKPPRTHSAPATAAEADTGHQTTPVGFELQDPAVDRGPAGTVPVVRKDLSALPDISLEEYLAKRGKRRGRGHKPSGTATTPTPEKAPADPNPVGYFHATSGEFTTAYGAEAILNVWDSRLENGGDHSIMQFGLQNYDLPKLQSLEAGWEISNDQYGDGDPHLFVYYTTNGYSDDDDNLGGYNQDVDGWVQVSSTIYPAAKLTGVSTRGGNQQEISIKYALRDNNWWFQVQGEWIGYYPVSLFMGKQSVFSTLGDHASWVAFWGEVYTADKDPNQTTTYMGSGAFAEAGWAQACYQRNLKLETARDGTMADHNGTASTENSAYYDIALQMKSGGAWGSYFYAGGPGRVRTMTPIGGFFPPRSRVSAVSRNPNQLDLFITGNDGVVYTSWWNPTTPWSGAANDWAPIGGFFPAGAPVAAVSRNPDQLDLFITGNDGVVYTSWWNPTTPWSGAANDWAPIGGFFPAGAPVAAVSRNPNQLDLFITGNDGVVYTSWWNPTTPWSGAANDWAPIGGFFPAGAPVAAVSRNPDQLDLFITGNDGVVYTSWWNPTTPWSGAANDWAPIGGFFPAGAPVAAVSRNPDQLDLFITGNDGVVYTSWWNPTTPWSGAANDWAPIGGFFPAGAPVAAVSRNPNQLDLFITGNDGVVYTSWWNPTTPWSGAANDWAPIGGFFPAGAPVAAVSRNPNQLDLFITGNDGVVNTDWWNPTSGWTS